MDKAERKRQYDRQYYEKNKEKLIVKASVNRQLRKDKQGPTPIAPTPPVVPMLLDPQYVIYHQGVPMVVKL